MFQHKFHVPDLKASTLAVDENRRIVVADSANRCIHVISLDTGETRSWIIFIFTASYSRDTENAPRVWRCRLSYATSV